MKYKVGDLYINKDYNSYGRAVVMMIVKIEKDGSFYRTMWWRQGGDDREWLAVKKEDFVNIDRGEVDSVFKEKILLETEDQKRAVIASFLECGGYDGGY